MGNLMIDQRFPHDWYWLADDGRLFSSAASALVASDDDDYEAWVASGMIPTRWPCDDAGEQTEASLAVVLAPHGLYASKASVKLAAVNARRDQILAAGYQHNFGGSAGVRTLDNRSAADAINWLGLKGLVDAKLLADEGADLLSLRDASNETFTASVTTVSAALVGMGVWRASVLATSWAFKDAIAAAEDDAALDAIDIDAGWPS